MLRLFLWLSLLCAGCGVTPQPKSARTTAAFEVPLPTAADNSEFVALLRKMAEVHGYHVDAASSDELRQLSDVSPITLNATVWRGNDEEVIASAMDFRDHLGRVWLSFSPGEDPHKSSAFQSALMTLVKKHWRDTASLPIMPSGAIPLVEDLTRTASGYVVNPAARVKYQK